MASLEISRTLNSFTSTVPVTEIAKKLAQLPKKNTQRPRVAIVTQGTLPTIVAIGYMRQRLV
jgi:hypothetical protein